MQSIVCGNTQRFELLGTLRLWLSNGDQVMEVGSQRPHTTPAFWIGSMVYLDAHNLASNPFPLPCLALGEDGEHGF